MLNIETIINWAFFNATILFILWKSGWFDWYEAHKPKALQWIPACSFCFGLRLSIVEATVLCCISGFSVWLFIQAFAVGAITFIIYKLMHQ